MRGDNTNWGLEVNKHHAHNADTSTGDASHVPLGGHHEPEVPPRIGYSSPRPACAAERSDRSPAPRRFERPSGCDDTRRGSGHAESDLTRGGATPMATSRRRPTDGDLATETYRRGHHGAATRTCLRRPADGDADGHQPSPCIRRGTFHRLPDFQRFDGCGTRAHVRVRGVQREASPSPRQPTFWRASSV